MRLEQLPILLGVLLGLVGLLFVWDAVTADGGRWSSADRRRRPRAERDRRGEAIVGLGVLCLAAALAGRDTWRYGTVAVLVGTILLLAGAALNWRFLRETLFYAGPARRQPERAPREPGAAERHAGDRTGGPTSGPTSGATSGPTSGATGD